jgi:hypothetical protein
MREMSWHVRYKVELDTPLTAELASRIADLEPELSEGSSGFSLSRVVGQRTLEGSTQPSRDWRTVDDVLKILGALRDAENALGGKAFIKNLADFEDAWQPISELDFEEVRRGLMASWGAVEAEHEEPEPAVAERVPFKKIEELLTRARADFEIWKRSKQRE